MRKALQFLGILHESDIEWLARNGHRRQVKTGTVLIQQGFPIDSLYVVLQGRLSVRLELANSNKARIATLLSGEILGEITFVDCRLPLASVIAEADSTLLAVPRNLLSEKLSYDLAFASRFYRAVASFLADRLRTTVGRFGYGLEEPAEANEFIEIEDGPMDEISVAAMRFDRLLRNLAIN